MRGSLWIFLPWESLQMGIWWKGQKYLPPPPGFNLKTGCFLGTRIIMNDFPSPHSLLLLLVSPPAMNIPLAPTECQEVPGPFGSSAGIYRSSQVAKSRNLRFFLRFIICSQVSHLLWSRIILHSHSYWKIAWHIWLRFPHHRFSHWFQLSLSHPIPPFWRWKLYCRGDCIEK